MFTRLRLWWNGEPTWQCDCKVPEYELCDCVADPFGGGMCDYHLEGGGPVYVTHKLTETLGCGKCGKIAPQGREVLEVFERTYGITPHTLRELRASDDRENMRGLAANRGGDRMDTWADVG